MPHVKTGPLRRKILAELVDEYPLSLDVNQIRARVGCASVEQVHYALMVLRSHECVVKVGRGEYRATKPEK